jgi:2-succinyl-5-enolpyruvyl-6-hydroxy-3-cyclohexene-1-carboxylate synthase
MASDRSVLAVIGDLAALHDLNSLPLLLNQSVTLVIVNNHGGGIFRFLPLAVSPDKREKYWETPHPFGFADAAAQFGIEYHNPTSVSALKECLSSVATGPRIVECVTDRDKNARLHKSIADQIRELDFKWPH